MKVPMEAFNGSVIWLVLTLRKTALVKRTEDGFDWGESGFVRKRCNS